MRSRAFDQAASGTTDLFGALASALEARVLAADQAGPGPEHVRLLFDPASVELDRLREGLTIGTRSPRVAELTGPRAALAALRDEVPAAAVLLAVHDAAHRPRVRARILGVVNVTPDSFSDGGHLPTPERAVQHGLELVHRGADLLDVGGESTRPGAAPVSAEEELERVLPVVDALAQETDVPISIDTTKASVARAAMDHGATIVNDVSAGRIDPELLPLVAERDAEVVLMHMRGTPRDMQGGPLYEDVLREVTEHLRQRVAAARAAGVATNRIAVDPGIGFGKRLQDNLALLRRLFELRSLGLPIVIGVSRKSFLGALSGTEDAADRDFETVAATALACAHGADVHRVHDVDAARRALAVAEAIRTGGSAC